MDVERGKSGYNGYREVRVDAMDVERYTQI